MNPIDLDRHAVLEASAGTGETHAIEELVLRLITEKDVRLEEILVVTFTEKATGELRGRLRAALEKALANNPAQPERLRRAVDHFDQAAIFTLHAFCQRVLREYPIEQGHEGRGKLVSDADLMELALREVQRRVWRQEYGVNLREVLDISGYDRQEAGKWEKQVRNLALNFRPQCGQRLEPAPTDDWPKLLHAIRQKLENAWSLLRTVFGAHPNMGALEFLRERLGSQAIASRPLTSFIALLEELNQESGFTFASLLTADLKADSRSAASAALTLLDEVRLAADWSLFPYQLALRTIAHLQDFLEQHKKQHGLQSFDDMIAGVEHGLDPLKNPRAEEVAAKLRQRFRYGIVDEFQDTDPLQWRILRRIFLDGDTSRLFVVGDPKQAIFGFRGADLPTYLQATQEMIRVHKAQDCPLRTNWRSAPELLTGLNRLFLDGQWFPPEIRYLPVAAAPENLRPARIERDDTGRSAITVLDWQKDESLTRLRRQNARFIVAEIARLLGGTHGKPLLSFTVKNQSRALTAGDICLLVFRRREADPIVAGLRDANIPFSFYKQPGLWQSDEAMQLRWLLEALAQPEHRPAFRQALMTQFFRLAPAELAVVEDLPGRHPARKLFDTWLDLAAARKWSALFQSLLEDTGLFFQNADHAERRRANYRHLANVLTQEAYRKNLDLLGLTELFERREPGLTDDNVQPRETERPRVQIMTIHASKGLEFPVVFLAGGWTQQYVAPPYSYRDSKQQLVHTVRGADDDADAAKEAAGHDRLQEDRRLLYVALTRAMFKLYVPLVLENTKARMPGPAVNILAPALNKANWSQVRPPVSEIIVADNTPPVPVRPSVEDVVVPLAWKLAGPLFPALDANLSRRGIVIRSFSSLHRAALREQERSVFADEPARGEDEGPAPAMQEEPLRGPVFGNLVHGVLEGIDFAAVSRAATPEDLWLPGSTTAQVLTEEIERYLPRLPARLPEKDLRALCRTQVANLVWHALNTPLKELGCSLGQIAPADRLPEVEFHFPQDDGESPPREVSLEEGFLTGFMDLVVRGRGRYFLVDWKTNLLPAYGRDDIERAMTDSDYHRQYRLYLQALLRWLRRSLGPAFDWARDLGGVYYLFVRGLTGHGDGVFFRKPVAEDLKLQTVLAVNQ